MYQFILTYRIGQKEIINEQVKICDFLSENMLNLYECIQQASPSHDSTKKPIPIEHCDKFEDLTRRFFYGCITFIYYVKEDLMPDFV